MDFQVGDKVVHRSFGPGEIISLDEKMLSGKRRSYYVVSANHMTVWVPVDGPAEGSLRPVLTKREFKKVLRILSSPSQDLAEDRFKRQNELAERMRGGSIQELCGVVRDLSARAHTKKMNENDNAVLRHAIDLLVAEWQLSLETSPESARTELDALLASHPA